jgi:hypothetical protein
VNCEQSWECLIVPCDIRSFLRPNVTFDIWGVFLARSWPGIVSSAFVARRRNRRLQT